MSSTVEVRMPKLGDTVAEGTVVEWLVAPGAEVAEGQPLLEITTDKVSTDYPSEVGGTLVEILVGEGETVPVGTPIARLATDGHAAPPPRATPAPEPPATPAPAPEPPAAAPEPPTTGAGAPRPTGAARAVAAGAGLDLRTVPGSGRHGRIRQADAEAAVAAATAAPPAPPHAPRTRPSRPSAMRQAIAAHMTRSWSGTPHAAMFAEADASAVLAARTRERGAFRADHGADLSMLPFVVEALAAALGAPCDVGVAVALEEGLIVPVVRAAGSGWRDAAVQLADLVPRARGARLAPEETRGGASTVTNIGVFGGYWAQPILNEGQATILGLGATAVRPVARADGVVVRPTVPLSLVYDRRRLDEVGASALLGRVMDELEGVH